MNGKSTRRMTDRQTEGEAQMRKYRVASSQTKNISENEVTEHTLESQIDMERNRATHRERQTEGLKMDLCKLAPVSCCFLPQIYAL